MSKVLVVPDVHLKWQIWELAEKICRDNEIDEVVCLGDTLDDFYSGDQEYRDNNARMVWLKMIRPEMKWLLGNHEVSYIINRPVTGNIKSGTTYAESYYRNFEPKIACIIDNVIFSHAGISEEFLEKHDINDLSPEEIVDKINEMSLFDLWSDESPLWARPQHDGTLMYQGNENRKIKQVVGHTPMETISEVDEVISCDVFSTNWGKQYGEEKMIIIDTETGEWEKVDIDYREFCKSL